MLCDCLLCEAAPAALSSPGSLCDDDLLLDAFEDAVVLAGPDVVVPELDHDDFPLDVFGSVGIYFDPFVLAEEVDIPVVFGR